MKQTACPFHVWPLAILLAGGSLALIMDMVTTDVAVPFEDLRTPTGLSRPLYT